MGPEGFSFGAADDRRITAAALITARRRESDQQVAVDRVDVGVFRPRAGGGASGVGGQMGIDQDRALLAQLRLQVIAAQRLEIAKVFVPAAVGLECGIAVKSLRKNRLTGRAFPS